jgi:hypothetical protein
MAKLAEVAKIEWKDLHILGAGDPTHSGWVTFSGFRIGSSDSLDEIVQVLAAPNIPKGSILAMAAADGAPPGTVPW